MKYNKQTEAVLVKAALYSCYSSSLSIEDISLSARLSVLLFPTSAAAVTPRLVSYPFGRSMYQEEEGRHHREQQTT